MRLKYCFPVEPQLQERHARNCILHSSAGHRGMSGWIKFYQGIVCETRNPPNCLASIISSSYRQARSTVYPDPMKLKRHDPKTVSRVCLGSIDQSHQHDHEDINEDSTFWLVFFRRNVLLLTELELLSTSVIVPDPIDDELVRV